MIDLRHGDCIERMKDIPDNSVDLVLTDPPYEIGFMGKKWDNTGIAFNVDMWKEAYRVLKPGGYLMAFSGTRTYHRMAVAIEDAGFEIKDMIEWVYGNGFPKALSIDKALDKLLGAEREVIGQKITNTTRAKNCVFGTDRKGGKGVGLKDSWNITAPSSDIAKQYEGYKTSLKPAHEPICLAMKPLSEKNFAENVMKWGTGGLNIDGCRVGNFKNTTPSGINRYNQNYVKDGANRKKINVDIIDGVSGRYPANLIISEDIAPVLDKQSGHSKSSKSIQKVKGSNGSCYGNYNTALKKEYGVNDEGGASRFFYNAKIEEEDYIPFKYTAKASKKERNSDINGNAIDGEAKQKIFNGKSNKSSTEMKDVEKRFTTQPMVNNHATVKPISIMEYLAKLGLPPYNAVVLDMFAGSGSTGMAIEKINKETGSKHKTILIERESEYIEIIKKRCCLEEV